MSGVVPVMEPSDVEKIAQEGLFRIENDSPPVLLTIGKNEYAELIDTGVGAEPLIRSGSLSSIVKVYVYAPRVAVVVDTPFILIIRTSFASFNKSFSISISRVDVVVPAGNITGLEMKL